MKKKIQKINNLLIEHYGIPERPKRLPDPLDIIIGTILSQNTNDKNSYKAFLNLKKSIKRWDELLQMKPSQVEKLIKVAGLGKQKSRAIINLLKNLKENNGKISLSHIKKLNDDEIIDELTSHKGIGVKTASCVLLFALGRNVCPVDTHVHRILNRVGIVKTSTPDKTFYSIEKNIPENSAHSFHTNLLRLGREYCTPTNPKCYDCPIESECSFAEKNFENKKPIRKNDFFLLDSIN
ncbi:MAG: endonuclease III [Ignavibacterium sp.]